MLLKVVSRYGFCHFVSNYNGSKGALCQIREILDFGADPNQRHVVDILTGEVGRPVLNQAIQHNAVHLVKMLLHYGACPHAYHSLHAASTSGLVPPRCQIVQLLVDHGCDVNELNTERSTPLMHLCEHGKPGTTLPIAKVLVNNGARVYVDGQQGRTPLKAVAGAGMHRMVHFLLPECTAADVEDVLIWYAMSRRYGCLTGLCHHIFMTLTRALVRKMGANTDWPTWNRQLWFSLSHWGRAQLRQEYQLLLVTNRLFGQGTVIPLTIAEYV